MSGPVYNVEGDRTVSGALCNAIASWIDEQIRFHKRWLSDELRWIPTGDYRYSSVDFGKFFELYRVALRLEAMLSFAFINRDFDDQASIPMEDVEASFFSDGTKFYRVKEAAIIEGIIRRSLTEGTPPSDESLDEGLPMRDNPHLDLG